MKTVFCIAVVMSIGLTVGLTNAQDRAPVRPPQSENDSALFESMVQELQEELEEKLAFHVNDIKTACDLSDVQVKKLKLASKGAASSAIFEMKKEMGEHMKQWKQMREDQDGGEQDEAPIPIEAGFGIRFLSAYSTKAEDMKIWKLTVKKTLTDEQQKKYEAVVAERRKFQRTVAVQLFIARVDSMLLLSADQRKQLTEFIDEEYGEELADFSAKQGEEGGIIFVIGEPGRKKPLAKNSPLQKILSEDQQTTWEKVAASQLESIRKYLDKNSISNYVRFQVVAVPEMELAPLQTEVGK